MDQLKRLVETVFSPLGITVVLFAAGIVLICSKRFVRLGRRGLQAGALLYLGFLFTPIAEILTLGLESQFSPLMQLESGGMIDRILILSEYGEDHPSYPITSNL